jgi:hypothetical protein
MTSPDFCGTPHKNIHRQLLGDVHHERTQDLTTSRYSGATQVPSSAPKIGLQAAFDFWQQDWRKMEPSMDPKGTFWENALVMEQFMVHGSFCTGNQSPNKPGPPGPQASA